MQYSAEPIKINSLIDDGLGKGHMIKVSNFQALFDTKNKVTSFKNDPTSQHLKPRLFDLTKRMDQDDTGRN